MDPLNTPQDTGWPRRRQLLVLAVAVGVLVVVIALIWELQRGFGRTGASQTAPAAPAGTFRPAAQQLRTLIIEPVVLRSFVSEERTEGKIAVKPIIGRAQALTHRFADTTALYQALGGSAPASRL